MSMTDDIKVVGLDLMDEFAIRVTPDDIIAKTGELVTLAVDKDMTGEEKFNWVLKQIEPTLKWIISFVAKRLVQLMYEVIVAKTKEIRV